MADVTIAIEATPGKLVKGAKDAGEALAKAASEGLKDIWSKLGFGKAQSTFQQTKESVSGAQAAGGASMSESIASGVAAGLAAGGVIALLQLIGDAVSGLPIITAIMKILKLIIMLLLMPLIPILKPVLILLAGLAKGLAAFMSGFSKVLENSPIFQSLTVFAVGLATVLSMLGQVFKAIFDWISNLFKTLMDPKALWAMLVKGWQMLVDFGKWMWDMIVKGFKAVVQWGQWLWNQFIVPGFEQVLQWGTNIWKWFVQGFINVLNFGKDLWDKFISIGFNLLKTVGSLIWDTILKPAWEWFKDIGTRIWDNILKPAWDKVASAIMSIWSWVSSLFGGGGGSSKKGKNVSDAIITPSGVVNTHPDDYIIATKNPRNLGGAGTTIININNPVIREENDIKKLVQQFQQALYKEQRRYNSYV